MQALILAAGRGSRLDPLTRFRPKHLLPIAGKPIIGWQIEILHKCGIDEIIVVKHHLGDIMEHYVKELCRRLGMKVTFVEQGNPQGTAHAVEVAEDYVKPPFLLLYGDVTIREDVIKKLLSMGGPYSCIMVGVKVRDPWNYGVLVVREGVLVDIVEKPPKGKEPSDLINAGIYLFNDDLIFDAIHETGYSPRGERELTDSIRLLNEISSVAVVEADYGWWFDVGRPWDLLDANLKVMADRVSQACISENVRLGNQVIIIPPVFIGNDCELGPGSVIGPFTVIMNGCTIGRNAKITNTLVLEKAMIGNEVHIVSSIIGSNVTIGDHVTIYDRWDNGGEIWAYLRGSLVNTHHRRFGAVIGDYSAIAEDTIIAPGITIMPFKKVEGEVVIDDVL
ncbi:MAG: hypothetical protein DRN15_05720 [Thermoprotei archaeon]|nr:MAG: hypothetical protein DRN15_05720 [Thermoprotei archaeon]RLF24130.1 MAG: hypothetical protein DRM97_03935 [Thermoprotei archaeon]